ncbi:hypothetical protein CYMTET_50997 [Cymbomonas tetramitiformis]|uniref:Uncharacterized protein n=1 Tax=Cymbomonas tetramitiformis TaxID=36881 RepID=A0AAE0BM11_9CHLO|nr:hypothetical protein CYMTET_50997 [Cymbomonas tetramitiformis]
MGSGGDAGSSSREEIQTILLNAEKFLEDGDPLRAANEYSKALELDDAIPAALLGRASCFLELGMGSSALVDAEMTLAAEASKATIPAMRVKARALVSLDLPRPALEIYRNIVATVMTDPSAAVGEDFMAEVEDERLHCAETVRKLPPGKPAYEEAVGEGAPGNVNGFLVALLKEEGGAAVLREASMSNLHRTCSSDDDSVALETDPLLAALLAGEIRLPGGEEDEELKATGAEREVAEAAARAAAAPNTGKDYRTACEVYSSPGRVKLSNPRPLQGHNQRPRRSGLGDRPQDCSRPSSAQPSLRGTDDPTKPRCSPRFCPPKSPRQRES